MDKKIRLAETLKRRIISMELAPGAIVDEISLSEEFGISRSPVRELIRQMAAEGYLELEANRAARVSSMSHQSLRNFFLAAPLVYIATTQLAAINASSIDIDQLKEIQMQFRKAIDENDLEGRVYYNNQFHLEIGKISQNAYLMPSLERLLIDHARLGKIFYRQPTSSDMQEDLDTAVLQHDQIIDAIERHNAGEAGELIRVHMDLSRRRMTEYVVPAGIDVPLTY